MNIPKVRPLFVSARRTSWRMVNPHADEMDARYSEVRKNILQRDDFTCQYCQFRSEKYQHIHHIDHNHGNNDQSNLVTACPLCHQCFHLGLAGIHNSGVIIYAEEISQAELNNICRAVFVAVYDGKSNEAAAKAVYDAFESRSADWEEYFGNGTSNPASVGQAFIEMDPKDYQTRQMRMPGIRLLPRLQAFGKEVAHWKSEKLNFGRRSHEEWGSLMPQLELSSSDNVEIQLGDVSDQDQDEFGYNSAENIQPSIIKNPFEL